jgi:hypothetical protein
MMQNFNVFGYSEAQQCPKNDHRLVVLQVTFHLFLSAC